VPEQTVARPATRHWGTSGEARQYGPPDRVVNAMTVDVEDYFQVSAFDSRVPRASWDAYESRVCANTDRLLELFADRSVTATFFVLGWVAQRFPSLVRRIAEAGHEVASHGYSHRLVYAMKRSEFAEDLRRASDVIGCATGVAVRGYRAPSYSIVRESFWALDELVAQGFVYDASIFPIHHDRYGVPNCPRFIHAIRRVAGTLWECPGATVRVAGHNLPIGGGGYFRLLPYSWTRWGIQHVNEREGQPVTFYIHPWEIDPAQPRVPAARLSRFRHYRTLNQTEGRLKRLLSEFRFGTVLSVLPNATAGTAVAEPALALGGLYTGA
jgi:polysaccharide deacetylase family protein (PEP-CTERM system associated)